MPTRWTVNPGPLELSRIGRSENPQGNVDIDEIVQEIVEQCRMQFPDKTVSFEVPTLPHVWESRS